MTVVDLDYALLRKVSQGNERAFAELMQRHQDRVYRLALRLLRQTQEAEDAAQEVFLKAYQNAGRFTPTSTVAAWLNRITANHCLNRLRSRKVRKEVAWEDLDSPLGQTWEVAGIPTPAIPWTCLPARNAPSRSSRPWRGCRKISARPWC